MRHALRLLGRTPGATLLVLTILSLAVAANVTLFSVLDAALFRGVALPEHDRLINIYSVRARGGGYGGLSLPDYRDVADALRADAELFGYGGLMASTSIGGAAPEVAFGELVTGNYFSASGAPLTLGRGFTAADDEPGETPRVVLGHRFWQRRFASDPAVLGQAIRLNGLAFTIVGVASDTFPGLLFSGLSADIFVPISAAARFRNDTANRAERWMFTKARLTASASVERASAMLDVTAARLAAAFPETNKERTLRALPSSAVMVNPEADPAIRPLAAAVIALGLLVLVIASTNVASVLAARAATRSRELAIRISIGATRAQLIQLLSAEALLLGIGALAIGLGLSHAALAGLQSWRPSFPVPIGWTFAIDGRVLVFAVTATLLTMIAIVILPAWHASRVDPLAALRAHASGRLLGRARLLIPQIALSLVLLVVAGLFARSLQSASALRAGFNPRGAGMLVANPGLSGYDEGRARQFWDALVREVESAPGVRAAAITDRIPLDLYGSRSLTAKSEQMPEAESMQAAHVGARYFEVLQIPILRGRAFTALDLSAARRAAIVSRSAAAHLWPARDAIGQRVQLGGANGEWHEVVGVAGDVPLLETLGEADAPMIYLPFTVRYASVTRVVAASSDGRSVKQVLLNAGRAVDPEIAIIDAQDLETHLDTIVLPYRAAALVALAAGVFGLLLTMAGCAASVAQALAWRLRELSIRIALGASRADMIRATSSRVLRATAVGLLIGVAGSVAAARALGGYLFGISPLDPLTLTAVPTLVVAAIAGASLPALRKAANLDASAVLRQE
jgi:predicted permease